MLDIAPTYSSPTAGPEALPGPLPEPAADDIRLERVMAALSDPLRLSIVRRLLLDSDSYDMPCGWFGIDRPKSTVSHHFKTLREAGVLRQRQYGLQRRNRVRYEELNERFPGLLGLVLDWSPKEEAG